MGSCRRGSGRDTTGEGGYDTGAGMHEGWGRLSGRLSLKGEVDISAGILEDIQA